jgi:hypothetical protein|tara:strand:- start:3046 stop:3510 length:465 start_codon:yes stop_codon:yes gene_type:complete
MADLISAADKADMELAIVDVHDTFARDITIYQNKTEILVATNPVFESSYNALYQKLKNAQTSSSKTVVTRTVVSARVQYRPVQEEQDEGGIGAQVNVQWGMGELRLKLDEVAYKAFKFATKIEIDGIVWRIVTDASRAGLFGPQYYVLYLERDE